MSASGEREENLLVGFQNQITFVVAVEKVEYDCRTIGESSEKQMLGEASVNLQARIDGVFTAFSTSTSVFASAFATSIPGSPNEQRRSSAFPL